MEEEKKVAEVEEVKAEEPKQEGGMQPNSKKALISFILAVIGFAFAWGWLGSLVGLGLGVVSLVVGKKNEPKTEQQPFKTFAKIAKPVAIVDIIVGAVMFVVALIVTIVIGIGAIAAANA